MVIKIETNIKELEKQEMKTNHKIIHEIYCMFRFSTELTVTQIKMLTGYSKDTIRYVMNLLINLELIDLRYVNQTKVFCSRYKVPYKNKRLGRYFKTHRLDDLYKSDKGIKN